MKKTRPKAKAASPPPPGFPLNQLLRDQRMSKRQLAKLSGIPLPMVNRLAKPHSNPTWQTLLRIADALQATIHFDCGRRTA